MENGNSLALIPETADQLQIQIARGEIITAEQASLLKSFAEYKVTDDGTDTEGKVILAKVKKFTQLLDTVRKTINKPYQDAITKNDNWFRSVINLATSTKSALDGQVTGYYMKRQREAAAEQAKFNAQAQRQFEKQIEKGQVPAVPEPVAKLADAPETTTRTDESTTSIKMTYKWHWARPGMSNVKASSRLPDNCWIPDEDLISRTVRSVKKQEIANTIFGGEVIIDEIAGTSSRLKM